MRALLAICGVLFATFCALLIIPGIDLLAWHLLQPDGFGQKAILMTVEIFTLWPRFGLAAIIWAMVVGLTSVVVR